MAHFLFPYAPIVAPALCGLAQYGLCAVPPTLRDVAGVFASTRLPQACTRLLRAAGPNVWTISRAMAGAAVALLHDGTVPHERRTPGAVVLAGPGDAT
ncbi:hypothetical protein AURDEDRAFT_116721 [Auricularia subglabra TFB-10046 SS5]|uniref:Uncharacterized protein n=1 Tax=Auricularia subglabra (strain TFB-10046 / SS5) TaxID=717982 RepID=J0D034_AURST|nr:hypothetical protein AURDEDRAFT_116721 [Auricularia subglabra TFB-10046 SS5]